MSAPPVRGGVVLTTRGWTGAALTWTHALGSDTYTPIGDSLNAYDVAQALRLWLMAPARPWAAAITGAFLVLLEDTYGIVWTYTFTGSTPTFVSVTPTSVWSARFGHLVRAAGTIAVVPGSVGWERRDTTPGLRGREGGWRLGHPLGSPRRPSCELVLDLEQYMVWREGVLVMAAERTAYVWDELDEVWRWVAIGKIETRHPEDDTTLKVVRLDVFGGP